MIDIALSVPFAAGLVAAVNPCGFAMLPAYLSYFLGLEEDEQADQGTVILRALSIGATMTLGFILVFGIMGVVLTQLSLGIEDKLPWVTVVIGIGLLILGIAMIKGFELVVSAPKLNKGGQTRERRSIFLFGISYAVASLSCTIPVFIALVTQTFSRESFFEGLLSYVAYGVGMGSLILVLTLGLALAKQGMVSKIRSVLPHINRISAILLVVVGIYVAYYGYWELAIINDWPVWNAPADFGGRIQTDLGTWLSDNKGTLGLLFAVIIGGSLVGGWLLKGQGNHSQASK